METEMMPKKDYVSPEINEVDLLYKGNLLQCVSNCEENTTSGELQ